VMDAIKQAFQVRRYQAADDPVVDRRDLGR
jgi:hypothetical protein